MKNNNKHYLVFFTSAKHPRLASTPMNGRCNYSCVDVYGKEALKNKVAELKAEGKKNIDIRTELGLRIWM